jgi:hypothetical protein
VIEGIKTDKSDMDMMGLSPLSLFLSIVRVLDHCYRCRGLNDFCGDCVCAAGLTLFVFLLFVVVLESLPDELGFGFVGDSADGTGFGEAFGHEISFGVPPRVSFWKSSGCNEMANDGLPKSCKQRSYC